MSLKIIFNCKDYIPSVTDERVRRIGGKIADWPKPQYVGRKGCAIATLLTVSPK
jgi:hypothetical protein